MIIAFLAANKRLNSIYWLLILYIKKPIQQLFHFKLIGLLGDPLENIDIGSSVLLCPIFSRPTLEVKVFS
jgi:hypothetical protein